MIDEEYIKRLEEENEILRDKNYNDTKSIERLQKSLQYQKDNVKPSDYLIKSIRQKASCIRRGWENMYARTSNDYFQHFGIVCNLGRRGGNTATAMQIIEEIYESVYICTDKSVLHDAHKYLTRHAVSHILDMNPQTYGRGSRRNSTHYEHNGNLLTTLAEFESNLMQGKRFYCAIFDGVDLGRMDAGNVLEKLAHDKAVCVYVGDCRGF